MIEQFKIMTVQFIFISTDVKSTNDRVTITTVIINLCYILKKKAAHLARGRRARLTASRSA